MFTEKLPQPPKAKILQQELKELDNTRIDDYYWLQNKKNPEVIAYLKEEQRYTEQVMQATEPLQKQLYKEILSRIKEDDESYPLLHNGYFYYNKTLKSKQYSIYYRKKAISNAPEEILFDVNTLASGHQAFIFAGYEISPDNQYAAYLYNTTGSYAEFTLKIKNLYTNNDLDIELNDITSIAWANDSETFFYTKIDNTLRPYQVYRQNLHANTKDLVYQEDDGKFSVHVDCSKDRQFLIINSSSKNTSEELILNANNPMEAFQVFLPRILDTEYQIYPHTAGFYLYYKDKTFFNGKLLLLPKENYSNQELWQEIISHNPDVYLSSIDILADFILVQERFNSLNNIKVLSPKGKQLTEITFSESVYVASLLGNPEFNATTFRYQYSSLNRPATLFEYKIINNTTETLKITEIPSGFSPENYIVERLWAKGKDDTKIPMAIVYKKNLVLDGSAPTLLYGYGSYGHNTEANFRSSFYSLIDRGFIFAIAQVRGGCELGENWYQQGKLLNKKNTFNDFISCAEHLIQQNFTAANKLAIMGGSAGGLLVTASMNMRPDLFRCVVAEVPFVDVVTTMLNESLPLTIGEYEEWGNPQQKEYYEYMLEYSPYDNVISQTYPNILVTGGINDSQVLFHEPTKFVAKLRELKTDNNLLLLHMNMESGHGGATGKYDSIKEFAFVLAFILKTINQ